MSTKSKTKWYTRSRAKRSKRLKPKGHFGSNGLNERRSLITRSAKKRSQRAKWIRAMKDDGFKPAQKRLDDAIAALVYHVGLREPRNGPRSKFSGNVYEAATRLVHACEALRDWRSTHAADYDAEIERRRQLGLAIDPTTAETTFWYADMNDPYDIRDPEVWHERQYGRERFARSPGGEWVHFNDLPAPTSKAIWKRDGRKLSFPYGLHPDDDVINYPPGAQSPTSARRDLDDVDPRQQAGK
jgi:hypothetical protein